MMDRTPRSPAELRASFRSWAAEQTAGLAPFRAPFAGSMERLVEHDRVLHRMLYDAGWSRVGWPEECGGLGGDAVLRGVVYEELSAAGCALPATHQTTETLAPALIRFAPHLARRDFPAYLRGDELWCQGFSEPEAGSDLASLTTRATLEGDLFRVAGQKTWTSMAPFARRCLLLARTGTAESRHRGLSMLWVDLESSGVTVRPILAANARNEFGEIFFDDVLVPASHLVGELHGGWGVALFLLQFERSMWGWQRQAYLHLRMQRAVERSPRSAAELATTLGEAYLALYALRRRCQATIYRLARGKTPGPEISVDKILLSTAEHQVFDAIRELLWPALEIDPAEEAEAFRQEWFYTRPASVYGGAVEVQKDIVAEHLLGLPRGRHGG